MIPIDPPPPLHNTVKSLILDSHDRIHNNKSIIDLHFHFNDAITVNNVHIDYVTFTTKLTINDPYVLVFVKQFKTTHFSDQYGKNGCYAKLLLVKAVDHNNMFTYHYKNYDQTTANQISITLEDMNFMFMFPSIDKITPGLELQEISSIKDNVIEMKCKITNIDTHDKLRLISNVGETISIDVLDIDYEHNKIIFKSDTDMFREDVYYPYIENMCNKIDLNIKHS